MVFEHDVTLPDSGKQINRADRNTGVSAQSNTVLKPKSALIGKDQLRADAPSRRIGYIRVSTASQITDRQTLQLEVDCDELHIERISGAAETRPVFDAVIASLEAGDTLVVSDLDRAFRSAVDAMLTADHLRQRQVHFRIHSIHLDTASEEGELFYTILAAFAQFERRIISRRTREGLAAARRRGVILGRPSQLSSETIHAAHDWMANTGLPCRYVAALLSVSRITLQRGFHREGLIYPIPKGWRITEDMRKPNTNKGKDQKVRPRSKASKIKVKQYGSIT